MCLKFDESYTRRFLEIHKGEITVYKIVKRTEKGLESFIYPFEWKPGINNAVDNRTCFYHPSPDVDFLCDSLFHAFLNYQHTERILEFCQKAEDYRHLDTCIIQLKVHTDNILGLSAYSRLEVAFFSAYLSQEEYDKAFNKEAVSVS